MRRFAVGAVLLGTLALAGCIVFIGPITIVQQDVIGKVRVSFTVCASGDPDASSMETHGGCPDRGNQDTYAESGSRQVLIAFRVPEGTTPPTAFTGSVSTGASLAFSRSPTYEAELTTLVPPPAGQVWVGYISAQYEYDNGADGTPAQSMNVSLDFELPRPGDGTPFAGPFQVRPVVGGRTVGTGFPSSRRVNCGEFGAFGGETATVCIDSPSPSTTGTNLTAATRDLGIAGTPAAGDPGARATVPFTARYAGSSDPAASFALSAATSLPGAGATPSRATLAPASDSTNAVEVAVDVPRNAAAGTYAVTLTGRLANGQQRSGTALLTVRDRAAPGASGLALRPSTFTPLADASSIVAARTRVSYRLNEPASVRFTVQRALPGRRAGRRCVRQRRSNRRARRCTRYVAVRGSFRHAGRQGANSFRFTGYVGGRRLRRGTYRLNGVPTDAAGNRGRAVRARFRTR